MLTGRYAQNTKVTRNSHAQFVASGLEHATIGSWLQDAGYRTALIGKYLNGYPDPYSLPYRPPGWDFWRVNVGSQASYHNYSLVDESGEVRTYGTAAEDHTDDVRGRLAIEFIETTPAEQPLFLWLSFYAPHIPSTAAPRHVGLLAGLTAPRPPSFNEADVGDKSAWLRGRAKFNAATIAQIDARYASMARSLQAADEWVAGIVGALEASGRLDDSYLVFLSDNGWMAGQHRLALGKGLPYEESVRMLLHVRGPGITPGAELKHLVGNVDLAPILAEWAGLASPPEIDGRSFAPLLNAEAPMPVAWRQAYPLFFQRDSGSSQPGWRGVRTRTHAYIEWTTGDRELYDMRNDPHQLTSLHRKAPAKLKADLAKLTAVLNACAGPACRAADGGP